MTDESKGNVVVFQINGIGDQLMAWPCVRALNSLFPGRLILVVSQSMPTMIYHDVPFVDKIRVGFKDNDPREIEYQSLTDKLADTDIFINLCEWLNEPVWNLINDIRPRHTVGFQDCFHDVVSVTPSMNTFDRMFGAAQILQEGLEISSHAQDPVFSDTAVQAAKKIKEKYISPQEKVLFLHPETLADKQWTTKGFSKVLELFLEQRPEYKVFVCSLRPYDVRVTSALSNRVFHISPPLEPSMALVGLSDLFLGVDSCFLHAADLYRIPAVGLFGPTDPRIWGFRFGTETRTIRSKREADVAQAREDQMTSLNVEDVYRALIELS